MVITVEEGQSIQAAIDAAAPGDTIRIQEGVFREQLFIGPGKDQLRLVGAGPGQTILDGTDLGELTGLTIEEANHVTVAHLTLRHFGLHGIVTESSDGVFRSLEVTQCAGCGMRVSGSRNLIKSAEVHANGGSGIDILAGAYNYLLVSRVLANGATGVHVAEACNGSLILENEVTANGQAGISLRSDDCWLIGNRFRENHGHGIEAPGVARVLIYGNTSAQNRMAGIVGSAEGLVAALNQLSHNGVAGLQVQAKDDSAGLAHALFYRNDLCANASAGLDAEGRLTHTTLFQNAIDDNGAEGLHLPGARLSRILRNTVGRNKGPGLDLSEGAGNNLVDINTMSHNQGPGLRLTGASSGNSVRGNEAVENDPYDMVDESTEHENVFDQNVCQRSSPTELSG